MTSRRVPVAILKNLGAFAIGLVLVAGVWAAIEFSLKPWGSPQVTTAQAPTQASKLIPDGPGVVSTFYAPGVEERQEFDKYWDPDPQTGFINKKNTVARHCLIDNGKVLFNATYRTDEFRRRLTPSGAVGRKSRFIALFGCSFTFGIGVNDDETMAHYLGKLDPEARPYNYGVGAWGPHQVLSLVKSRNLRSEIAEPQGVGLYVMLEDHVRRAIGDSYWGPASSSAP